MKNMRQILEMILFLIIGLVGYIQVVQADILIIETSAKVQLIKEIRAVTSLGLKEAKDLVDSFVEDELIKFDTDQIKSPDIQATLNLQLPNMETSLREKGYTTTLTSSKNYSDYSKNTIVLDVGNVNEDNMGVVMLKVEPEDRIAFVKAVRAQFGLSLKEAKELMDNNREDNVVTLSPVDYPVTQLYLLTDAWENQGKEVLKYLSGWDMSNDNLAKLISSLSTALHVSTQEAYQLVKNNTQRGTFRLNLRGYDNATAYRFVSSLKGKGLASAVQSNIKRIYTVEEATKLSKSTGNTFRLRYK